MTVLSLIIWCYSLDCLGGEWRSVTSLILIKVQAWSDANYLINVQALSGEWRSVISIIDLWALSFAGRAQPGAWLSLLQPED